MAKAAKQVSLFMQRVLIGENNVLAVTLVQQNLSLCNMLLLKVYINKTAIQNYGLNHNHD